MLDFQNRTLKIEIEKYIMSVGNKVIQLRNVTEASISRDRSYSLLDHWGYTIVAFGGIFIVGGTVFVVADKPSDQAAAFSIILAFFGAWVVWRNGRPKYGLLLETSAGSMIAFISRNKELMDQVHSKIKYAMSHPNENINYRIITNNVIGSKVKNFIGGDADNSKQSNSD
jgi:hypothetical protein